MVYFPEYLDKFQPYIESGNHFANLAVQEPYGTMILKAAYSGRTKVNRYGIK